MSQFQKSFDQTIVRFREAGILDKIISGYTAKFKLSVPKDSKIVVLSLAHYETPMYVLAMMLIINLLAFFTEISFAFIRKKMKWQKRRLFTTTVD